MLIVVSVMVIEYEMVSVWETVAKVILLLDIACGFSKYLWAW